MILKCVLGIFLFQSVLCTMKMKIDKEYLVLHPLILHASNCLHVIMLVVLWKSYKLHIYMVWLSKKGI